VANLEKTLFQEERYLRQVWRLNGMIQSCPPDQPSSHFFMFGINKSNFTNFRKASIENPSGGFSG